MNVFDHIKEHIPILEVAKKFPDFYKSLQKSGHDYGTACPTGHSSQSGRSFKLVSDGHSKDFYYCHSCGISGNSFGLAQLLLEKETRETIEWFVKTFKLDQNFLHFKSKPKTDEEIQAENRYVKNTLLYEKLVEYGKILLFESPGEEALDYLVTKRKYLPDNIKQTPFFYMPKDAKKYLKDVFPDMHADIDSLSLNGRFGDNFRLCLPYRLVNGYTTGIIKRSTEPMGFTGLTWDGMPISNQRWDSSKGLQKDDLFGLHKIKANSTETIFIVEGYPDCVYIPTLGYITIVGLGQGQMSRSQPPGLIRKGIKNVVLCLDNDKVGPKNTVTAIQMLLENNLNVFTVRPGDLGAYKDPDEFVIANGVDALVDVINNAVEAEKWIVDHLYKEASTPLMKNKAFTDAIEFSSKIISPASRNVFIEDLAKKSGTPRRIIEKTVNDKSKTSKSSDKLVGRTTKDVANDKGAIHTILTKLVQHDIVPFQETTTGDYAIYNKQMDHLSIISSLDKIKNMCANYGVTVPEVLPTLQVIFDVNNFEKISIEDKTLNIFTPSSFMLEMAPNDDVITPEAHFPNTWKLINNLIANDNKDVREHFINWLAYCFQTRQKSMISWVLKGEQGIGKNLFFDHVIKPFYGEKVCRIVENADLHSGYNGYLLNKMFIVFNEIAPNTNEKHSIKSVLKAIVTDPMMSIEEKYQKKISVPNNINTMFFSNENNPIVLEKDDRRYCVVKTGIALKKLDWFKYRPFGQSLEEERKYFYQYLFNYHFNFDKANEVIETRERADMIESSMSQIEAFANAMKKNDYEWFNIMQSAHLKHGNNLFNNGRIDVKPEEVNNQMPKDLALQLYNAIYPGSPMTMKTLTNLLTGYNIVISRINNKTASGYYYVWTS